MNSKEINLEERREIQLKMLDELHDFCESHKIRYSLAYGTLIGAIRHKGFIPWDDDVDIIMPIQDMLRLKRELKSETIKYCDVDTEKHYEFPFSRIAFRPTYQKLGRKGKTYGVNIDLYPVISLPKSVKEIEKYFNKAKHLMKIRMFFTRLRNFCSRYLGTESVIGFDWAIRAYRSHILRIKSTNYDPKSTFFFIVSGPITIPDFLTYKLDLFEETKLAQFEGHKYTITSEYDTFLKIQYGDYMQLPPEEKRHPIHGGHYYWIEK